MRGLASRSILVCALVLGCGPREGTLSIDLVTDLVPGAEIYVARTTLGELGDASEEVQLVELSPDLELTHGGRVAELRGLALGEHHVTLELLDEEGTAIATRAVAVRVTGSVSIRIVVTRDCIYVGCPGPDDPLDRTACLAGRCVAPACASGDCTEAECQTDGDCPEAMADCAAYLCSGGVCLAFETRGVCGDGTVCSPDVGCVEALDPTEARSDLDGDGAVGASDCAPGDSAVYAGAPEDCDDGVDQDCNGSDLGCPPDLDGDGWDALSDCNDGDASRSPEADDACGDGIDTDCDGFDTQCAPVDRDLDQWSVPADCDDTNPLVHPTSIDVCGDGIDQDCIGGDLRSCIGSYGQPCGLRGTCLGSSRQRLACARANGARRRSCLRCCVICANQSRFHWLNVDHDCTRAATRYCARNGRGGLEDRPGVDPIQWGTCSR